MKIYEPAIKSHINTMCNQFALGSEITSSEKSSTSFNMARWCKFSLSELFVVIKS